MTAIADLASEVLQGLRPPRDCLPSEWAETAVYIPAGNAIPGLIQFANAPYQREPLDLTVDPECERITLQWGAQVGKTTVALCAQAFSITEQPRNQLMMQPSQGDLQTWLETKFTPMVEANVELSQRLAKPRGRQGVNNQLMKSYPGGILMFSWAGSPKTQRGRSAPFVVCDEVDGYDRTAEGHPVSLLWQRAATFGDQRKLLEISTPTIKGASYIEAAFEDGDMRYFLVPCPHCGHAQRLVWAQVTWGKDDNGEHRPETAGYTCAECGVVWTEAERRLAIRTAEANGGGWQATRPFFGHASFHLSELYSLLTDLKSVVKSFLSKKRQGDLQTFVNVSLAETWEETGERVEASALLARAEDYSAPAPQGVAVLTAGIDMQEDRLELEVVGWGLGEESWSVDYRTLWGDPLRPEVWADLDEVLAETWRHESGALLGVSGACLDTGGSAGLTQAAYDYARGKVGRRLFAIKGVGGWGRPIVTAPSRKRLRGARPVSLFSIGVDEAKVVVSRRLQLPEPGPGYCHIPRARDPEWAAQITAETLRSRKLRGFVVREWHQVRPRNEALDCRVYAYAALKLVNPNIARLARGLAPSDDEVEAPEAPVEPEKPKAPTAGAPRRWRPKSAKRRRGGV